MVNPEKPPAYVFLWLLLSGISFLFLSVLGALTYLFVNHQTGSIDFPYWFYATSFFILMLSYFAERAKFNFRQANPVGFKYAFLYCLSSVFLFLLGQIQSWRSVLAEEAFVQTNNAYAFLYLLSGLHLLHVLAALPVMVYLFYQFILHSGEKHLSQIFFADQTRYRLLDQLIYYLHYMGVLWFLLLLVFSLLSLI